MAITNATHGINSCESLTGGVISVDVIQIHSTRTIIDNWKQYYTAHKVQISQYVIYVQLVVWRNKIAPHFAAGSVCKARVIPHRNVNLLHQPEFFNRGSVATR